MQTNSKISNFERTLTESFDSGRFKAVFSQNKWWILVIMILINLASFFYIRYSKAVYQSESQLKLDIKQNATQLGMGTMLQDENADEISGEIELLRSELFLARVVDILHFDVSIYSRGRFKDEELFIKGPVRVQLVSCPAEYQNTPIAYSKSEGNNFTLELREGEVVTGEFDKLVTYNGLKLKVSKVQDFTPGTEVGYYLVFNSKDHLINMLKRNLTIDLLNYNAKTIRLAYKDNISYKASYILGKIDSTYLSFSYQQKNLTNLQKIEWLTREMQQLETKLEDLEDYVESFTLKNRSKNLDLDFQVAVQELARLDSQRSNLNQRYINIKQLNEQVQLNKLSESSIVFSMLPQDVNTLVQDWWKIDQQMERIRLTYKPASLVYQENQQQYDLVRKQLTARLADLEKLHFQKLTELTKRRNAIESRFQSMPDKSTEFNKNQRSYKINEQLYLLLMQSKSEFEIAMAGSTPDFKILSPPNIPNTPIFPRSLLIIGLGVSASFVTAIFLLGILYVLNNKINSQSELERMVEVPFLGHVPSSKYKVSGLQIITHPKSIVTEAIRSLRTNLDFFPAKTSCKVITISSSVSGEGKSFLARNLGGVLAYGRKRVILLDLDMRKHKPEMADQNQGRGISTILIKRHTWEECIQEMEIPEFHFIAAGPHPPNPSELLVNGAFHELIATLKTKYDFIIMDTPPVGLVTDGLMAMKEADVSIYVFRANYSQRDFVSNLSRLTTIHKFTNLTIVLNAVAVEEKQYAYGYYEESKPRKNWWRLIGKA